METEVIKFEVGTLFSPSVRKTTQGYDVSGLVSAKYQSPPTSYSAERHSFIIEEGVLKYASRVYKKGQTFDATLKEFIPIAPTDQDYELF